MAQSPIVLLVGAYGETADKRRGGKVGIQKPGPKSARLQMFGDELVEEFAALRTDQEVRTFEVHGTVITRQALNSSWPLEEHLDDILITQRYIVKELPRDLTRLYAEALLLALRLVHSFPDERQAWVVYLTLPFLCLQTCQSFRATGKMREMGLRLLRFIRGDIQNLYNEAGQQGAPSCQGECACTCAERTGMVASGSSVFLGGEVFAGNGGDGTKWGRFAPWHDRRCPGCHQREATAW